MSLTIYLTDANKLFSFTRTGYWNFWSCLFLNMPCPKWQCYGKRPQSLHTDGAARSWKGADTKGGGASYTWHWYAELSDFLLYSFWLLPFKAALSAVLKSTLYILKTFIYSSVLEKFLSVILKTTSNFPYAPIHSRWPIYFKTPQSVSYWCSLFWLMDPTVHTKVCLQEGRDLRCSAKPRLHRLPQISPAPAQTPKAAWKFPEIHSTKN